jgi:hypothetical protein
MYVVCLKRSVNGTRKQTKQKIQKINLIGLKNNCHPSQHRRRQIRGVRWVVFFLFPRLKRKMKGARFSDVAAIQERVRAVLRSIPKEAFADSFQKLYERCLQCVVEDGDYFEGQ